MRESNRVALKEWAVVVQALAKGEQIFPFRKGGIIPRSPSLVILIPQSRRRIYFCECSG